MEVEYQRDAEKLCGAERDVGVRERPVGVYHVGPELATYPDALEEPADDVGYGEQLQPGLACHLAGRAFFVREEFEARGRVAEAVHLHAVDFVALEALVCGREYLYLDSRLLQVGYGGAQPRDFGIFVEPGVDGAYDEDFHVTRLRIPCFRPGRRVPAIRPRLPSGPARRQCRWGTRWASRRRSGCLSPS